MRWGEPVTPAHADSKVGSSLPVSTPSARDLALELAQLAPADREELLADLTADRRAKLVELIREAESLLRPSAPSFEAHFTQVEMSDATPLQLGRLSESQLRALLSSESHIVQARLVAAIRAGELNRFPSAVRRAVVAHLTRRCAANDVPLPQPTGRTASTGLSFWETLRELPRGWRTSTRMAASEPWRASQQHAFRQPARWWRSLWSRPA